MEGDLEKTDEEETLKPDDFGAEFEEISPDDTRSGRIHFAFHFLITSFDVRKEKVRLEISFLRMTLSFLSFAMAWESARVGLEPR